MVGAERRLADLQGPLELGRAPVRSPKSRSNAAKCVTAPGDLRISRSERRLGEGQRLLGERPGLPVLAALPQVGGGPVQQPAGLLPGYAQPLGVPG